VDDTDFIHSMSPLEEQLNTGSIQQLIDDWAFALDTTGGSSVADKSSWYNIEFKNNHRGTE
jgi:hypothetical protein